MLSSAVGNRPTAEAIGAQTMDAAVNAHIVQERNRDSDGPKLPIDQ